MQIGDHVKTHLNEQGTIISKALKPYDWVVEIENAAEDRPQEPYREAELTKL